MAITLNFASLSDVNPYVFGAGWTTVGDTFKIVSGSLRPNFTNGSTGFSIAIVNNPPTSGLLDVIWTTNHNNNLYSDYDGAVFCNSSGTGYYCLLNGDIISVYNITAGIVGSEVGYVSGLTYSAGAQFRATYNLSTNTINLFQQSVSTVTPVAIYSGLTPVTSMSNGVAVNWSDSGAAGIVNTTVATAAAAQTIDTIDSPIPLGTPDNVITTTGLGTLTSLTIGGIAVEDLVAPSGDGTFTVPNWLDGVQGVAIGASQTVIASDGTNTANSVVTITAQIGQSAVTLTSVNTSVGYLGNQIPLSVGDTIIYRTAANLGTTYNSIGADGAIATSYTGSQTIFKRSASTGIVTEITLINGDVAPSNLTMLWLMGM